MDMNTMQCMVATAGFTPSAGCWEDEHKIFAFSIESCGPATYGHPRYSLEYRKDTGELLHENRPVNRVIIYHTETGVICGRFASIEDAQSWLDGYMVSQSYKDRCYRIELAETYYTRHARKAR